MDSIISFDTMPIVNPVLVYDQLSDSVFPQPLLGETFILRREGVSIDLRSSVHGKLSGNGMFFLTNTRLVFYRSGASSKRDFLAYQINLQEIRNPKYEQPVFGANYLKGDCAPQHPGDPGDSWRISFNKGGSGTFLPALNDLLNRSARALSTPTAVRTWVVPSTNVGYIDPSDPSIVYIQQPVPGHVFAPPAE